MTQMGAAIEEAARVQEKPGESEAEKWETRNLLFVRGLRCLWRLR
jgi:hypothetical protein